MTLFSLRLEDAFSEAQHTATIIQSSLTPFKNMFYVMTLHVVGENLYKNSSLLQK